MVFVANYDKGVIAVDVSSLTSPKILSSTGQLGGSKGHAYDVKLTKDGGTLCVANDYQGLWLLNVKDPKKMVVLGKLTRWSNDGDHKGTYS